MSASRKGKRLTGEDAALWEGVTRSVKPIRTAKRLVEVDEIPKPAKAAKQPTKPTRSPAAPAAMLAKSVAPKAAPAIAPIEKRMKQKIARGSQAIDGRLDLHGHSQAEAHDALFRFLRRMQSRGSRLVLVITGKGGRGEGVLKRSVPMWLNLPEFRELVIGFGNAAIAHGGEGALYVRVRRARER